MSDSKILFTSHDLPEFFEGMNGWEPTPPFFPAWETGWQKCQALKDGQTTNFLFKGQTSEQEERLFDFRAHCLHLPSSPGMQALLCTITAPASPDPGREESDYRRKYAEFLGIAAHDLDAPLRKLSMLTQRLDQKFSADAPPGAGEYLQRIQSCVGDMRSLIDGLTAVSLAEDEIKMETCDVAEICRPILEELAVTSEAFGWEMDILPTITGDRSQLDQLFRQLLANAALYRRQGDAVHVAIKAEMITEEERTRFGLAPGQIFNKIVVADNGIGFSPAYADKIFDPFVRLNGKSEYPGSGMGLSLCRKIATLHHGFIYAEGNVNNGARFTLILPQSIN